LLQIGHWKLKKEDRKPSSMKIIITITTIIRIPYPIKHETPRLYTKVTEDHDELLQSLLKKVLIQLAPVNQKATKTIGGFCGYHKVHGYKTCECKKFRDIVLDFVDKKAISFEKQEEKKKTLVHVDNEKLGIYKNPMLEDNLGILYT